MTIGRTLFATGLLLLTAACCQNEEKREAPGSTSAQSPEAERLHDLIAQEWAQRLRNNPIFATYVGRHEYNDKLPDASLEAEKRRAEAARAMLENLQEIDPESLSDQDRINWDMLCMRLEQNIAEYEYGEHLIPLNSESGFHLGFAQLPAEMPFETVRDYENYLARLRAWPEFVAQHIEVMKLGLERGMTLPGAIMQGYESTIEPQIVEDPEQSGFFAPFTRFPAAVSEAERARLRERGVAAIAESVVPGYRTFLAFMTETYLPGCRDSLGASALPNGAAYYDMLVKRFTTLDTTAEEVHQIGLREVARIRAEMDTVIEQVGFEGDFAEFLEFLRTDPRFYAKTPEELLMRAAFICKKMDAKLPSLFNTLPRKPYGVAPVPDHIAPRYTGGRYVPAPEGSQDPGYYWVNTYALDKRPLYTQEALSLHEAVPGHHLQIALTKELESLPEFRRYGYLSAFGEGWGLYSEWLGLEAGFYTDPYSNFGRLTYEMWRACRLVVDTGVHAKGWTRQQVIDYLAQNTALSIHECTTETELGAAFDVRAFHDEVLKNGSIPLQTLEDQIDRWIARNQSAAAAP